MNKKYLIALCILVAVLIAGAVLFLCLKNDAPLPDDGENLGGESLGGGDGAYYPVETQPQNIEELIPQAFELAWNEVVDDSDPLYLKKLEELSSYTIDSVTEENRRYVIKTTVKAPNLGERLMNINYSEMPSSTDKASIDTYICELIDGLECVDTQAYAYAEWSGESINISFSEEFVDAMCGKLYSYARNALGDYLEADK